MSINSEASRERAHRRGTMDTKAQGIERVAFWAALSLAIIGLGIQTIPTCLAIVASLIVVAVTTDNRE